MKRFSYTALDADGQRTEGEMDATDESTIIDNLQASGYLPISTNEVRSKSSQRRFNILPSNRITNVDVHNVTRDLATMLNAGVPLAHALSTLTELTEKPRLRDLLEQIRLNVEGGVSLSAALENSDGPFSSFYTSMVRSGETTGNLELVMQRLSDYQRQAKQLRDAIFFALLYPTILLFVASGSLIVLLIYVVPQFQQLFDDLGKSLPWSTDIVIGLANIVNGYWWSFPIVVILLYAGSQGLLSKPIIRGRWHNLLLKLPIFGELMIHIEVTRMCRTLGTLTGNGVALLDGIALVRDTATNVVISEALNSVARDLEHGRGFSQTIADTQRFPQLVVQMIKVGEEAGNLAETLLKLAEIYDETAQNSIKRMLAILEPLLILGLGLLIAFIIVSILLAILGLNDLVI
tara:strand:- start:779 stop:1993 length:1215 start_codon:yes stop_codon:yes gene_type:complete